MEKKEGEAKAMFNVLRNVRGWFSLQLNHVMVEFDNMDMYIVIHYT